MKRDRIFAKQQREWFAAHPRHKKPRISKRLIWRLRIQKQPTAA